MEENHVLIIDIEFYDGDTKKFHLISDSDFIYKQIGSYKTWKLLSLLHTKNYRNL